MPARQVNDIQFNAPPPPLELAVVVSPPEVAAAGFSVTLTDAFPDPPVLLELQVITKVKTTDDVSAAVSVTTSFPLVATLPPQLSRAPPPLAVQLVELYEFHVSVVDCPTVMVVGDAVMVALTAPVEPPAARFSVTLTDD